MSEFDTGRNFINSVSHNLNSGSTSIFEQRINNPHDCEVFDDFFKDFKFLKKTKDVFPERKTFIKFIDFSEKVKKQSLEIVKQLKESSNWWTQKLEVKNMDLLREVNILRLKLSVFFEYLIDRNLPIHQKPFDILIKNLTEGPSFAVRQKKIFDYSIRRSFAINKPLIPEDLEVFEIERDINEIYPYRHLIMFNIKEDYSDILDWSFKKWPIEKKLFKRLSVFIENNIKRDVNLRSFDEFDAVLLTTSKKTFYKGNSIKGFEARFKSGFCNTDLVSEEIYKISFTTKNPGESRVIAIPDIPTRNFSYILRESTKELHNSPFDKYGKPRWNFETFLKPESDKFFIQVDQSKSGWTFPQELFSLYFKVLEKIYPDYIYFKYARDNFDKGNISYFINGSWEKPLRGFTLGMYDNIMSFILSCIFETFLEDLEENDPDLRKRVKGLFWGDDQIISVEKSSYSDTLYVWNKWVEILIQFGIEVNEKKSYISNIGTFCEVYSQGDYTIDKYMTYALMPFDSLRGINTFQRKTLWSQYYDQIKSSLFWWNHNKEFSTVNKLLISALQNTLNHIGYEFSEYEIYLPIELGGWIRFSENGKNTLWRDLMEGRFNVPPAFLNIPFSKKMDITSIPKFKKNLEKITESKFIKDLSLLLDYKYKKYNLSSFIQEKFKNFFFDSSIKDCEVSSRILRYNQKERLISYNSQEINSISGVLNKLFSEKQFKNSLITASVLKYNPSLYNFIWDIEQTPHRKINIEPYRAAALILKLSGKNPFNVKYLKEDKFSFKDLVSKLHINSNTKYSLPKTWYDWATFHDIDFDKLYHEFLDREGISILNFFPPYLNKEEKFEVESLDSITYWSDEYGYSFDLTPEETKSFKGNESFIILKKLGISQDVYFEKCFKRSDCSDYGKNESSDFEDDSYDYENGKNIEITIDPIYLEGYSDIEYDSNFESISDSSDESERHFSNDEENLEINNLLDFDYDEADLISVFIDKRSEIGYS